MNVEYDFSEMIAVALRNEFGNTRQTVKTVMGWTGASERTVKNWLAATHGPSGEHLVQLTKHSDEVFELVLLMADRKPVVTTVALITTALSPSADHRATGSAHRLGRSLSPPVWRVRASPTATAIQLRRFGTLDHVCGPRLAPVKAALDRLSNLLPK